MNLFCKYIPLSFIQENETIKQIVNTIVLSSLFSKSDHVTLSHYITGTQYGYNDSAKKNGVNKFLRISDITDNSVNWNTVPYCNCNDENKYLLQDNDIVIARTGGTTGKSFLVLNPPKSSIFAGYLIRIRTNSAALPEFLQLFFNSYMYWNQINTYNDGKFRPSVNSTKIENLILPKLTIEEQTIAVRLSCGEILDGFEHVAKKIKDFIYKQSKLTSLKMEISKQKEYVLNLKKTILQDAISGKLTEQWRAENRDVEPASELIKKIKAEKQELIEAGKIRKEKPLSPINESEIPFDVPDTWEWCRLGDLCSKTGSGSTPRGGKEAYPVSGVYFLRSQNVYNDGIRLDGIAYISENTHRRMQGTKVFQDDLLLNITGGSIGRCAIVSNEIKEANINQHVAIIRLIDRELLNYIHSTIISGYFYNQIGDCQTGAGREGLPKNKMDNILLPIPPKEEIKVISMLLQDKLSVCTSIEDQIKDNQYKAEMLSRSILSEILK